MVLNKHGTSWVVNYDKHMTGNNTKCNKKKSKITKNHIEEPIPRVRNKRDVNKCRSILKYKVWFKKKKKEFNTTYLRRIKDISARMIIITV